MPLAVKHSPPPATSVHLPMRQSRARLLLSTAQQPDQSYAIVVPATLYLDPSAAAVLADNISLAAQSLHVARLQADEIPPSRRGHFFCGPSWYVSLVIY